MAAAQTMFGRVGEKRIELKNSFVVWKSGLKLYPPSWDSRMPLFWPLGLDVDARAWVESCGSKETSRTTWLEVPVVGPQLHPSAE